MAEAKERLEGSELSQFGELLQIVCGRLFEDSGTDDRIDTEEFEVPLVR